MDILGPKLGPMVFQFPSFDRWKFPTQDSFLAVLIPFLKKLQADYKFVVEIRNKKWLDAKFGDVLREHNVALALTDTSFMPRPWEMKEKFDLTTADFTYVRWLGDRKEIEKQTTRWDKTIIDRTSDLKNWVEVFKSLVSNTVLPLGDCFIQLSIISKNLRCLRRGTPRDSVSAIARQSGE